MTALYADDGVRLDYTETGDPNGRPVVLLAGFKAPATTWRYQVGPLAEAGYRVLAIDLRGHGEAERPESGVDMARRGRDLHNVLTTLDLTGAVLIGGSMGGNTIWSYLDQFDPYRVAAAVIVDQTPKMLNTPDWPHGFYGYHQGNIDSYFATSIPETGKGTPWWRRGMRLVRLLTVMGGGDRTLSPGELALLDDHAKADWRPTIAACDLPALFVAGADSEFWPSSHAPAAAGYAANGEAAIIRNDGHATNIEQPHVFNTGLLTFLSRAAPASANPG